MSGERRVAFVTGAARGIGRRVALTLAERGYRIAANDIESLGDTLEELERVGAEALSAPGDVSDEGAVRGMVEAVMGGFGRVDVLVNNAGISLITPAEDTSLADWRLVLEVNPIVEGAHPSAVLLELPLEEVVVSGFSGEAVPVLC